jgi:HAD superfamily hydrolase (TIGR01509 family)
MTAREKVVFGSLDEQRIRGLLFDVDGTLSDTDDHMVNQLIDWLMPIAFLFNEKNPRKFSRWLVMTAETPANFLYNLADKLGVDGLLSEFYNLLSQRKRRKELPENRLEIIPGIQPMLARLSENYPLAVVSARDEASTMDFLEQYDLLPYFKTIVTSQSCQHTKPYPDPIHLAAERLNLKTSECLMIGDTIVDVRAGKAAGAQTLAVLCGFGTLRELKRAGADLILTCTPDILEILQT